MARALIVTLFCGAIACSGAGDARTEEVWSVDFQTYGPEVDRTADDLDLDRSEIEGRTLAYLREYFEGLPIRFELGVSLGSPVQSSICVRHGSESRFGRGILDRGNGNVVHDCGEPDGTEHGAFINRIGLSFLGQTAGSVLSGQQRHDLFARLLAMVVAHEIGHGLGLEHSRQDFGPGDIMKASPSFDVGTTYYFSDEAKAILATNLLFGGAG